MFTGLVEEVGRVQSIRSFAAAKRLVVKAPLVATGLRKGDSVAVNGSCLTVTTIDDSTIGFDLLGETLARTNLRSVRDGTLVNLERALAAGSPLGGHFVQGHIDCTASVIGFEKRGPDHRLEVELPAAFSHYAAFKGSIALNGVSLTIAELSAASFVVWIIPHTLRNTNLSALKRGDLVNVEFDLLAKYVERMLKRRAVHGDSVSSPANRRSYRRRK
jgi:riboflavin synthase